MFCRSAWKTANSISLTSKIDHDEGDHPSSLDHVVMLNTRSPILLSKEKIKVIITNFVFDLILIFRLKIRVWEFVARVYQLIRGVGEGTSGTSWDVM